MRGQGLGVNNTNRLLSGFGLGGMVVEDRVDGFKFLFVRGIGGGED